MKSFAPLSAALLLFCAPALHALDLPAQVTPSGTKFTQHCGESAKADMTTYRAKTCSRLLSQWQLEVRLQESGVSNVDLARVSSLIISGRVASVQGMNGNAPMRFMANTAGAPYSFPTAERAVTPNTSAGRR